MLRKYCVLVPIVAFCLLFMSCYFDNGHKEVSYGNVHFVNAGATMTIDPCPPPDNVDFVLPDERRIHLASVNKKQAIELFGEPFLVGKINQGATSYEEYGVKHVCTFVFENGQLTTVYATGGVKVINVLNDKSLTLPAKEPDQVEVFGKPTAVNYRKSQQPQRTLIEVDSAGRRLLKRGLEHMPADGRGLPWQYERSPQMDAWGIGDYRLVSLGDVVAIGTWHYPRLIRRFMTGTVNQYFTSSNQIFFEELFGLKLQWRSRLGGVS